MIKKIRRILKDKGKSAVALLLCVSMIAPIATRALSYDSPPQTAQTWNPVFYSDYLKHYNELKGYDLEPTGLAADTTNGINRITNNTGLNFPFHAAPRIQQRPGYENPKYVDFDNHFFYCVGRHQQSGFEVGMQLFHSPSVDEYNTEHLPSFITARSNGTEGDKFNFLMLAIACGYTSGWDNKRTENAAYYLVTQSIAWEIADGAHFTGAPADAKDLMPYLNADLADFKTKWVKVLENSFPADKSPLMYSTMHSPATGYAAQCGMKNMIEEVFFNVWMAAYYSSKLYPNWQENITSTYTQVQQGDDGYYHAYVDLFQSEQASIYLTGCQKTMYGDWEYVGTVGNIEEFRSPTGEIPENGDICTYTWPENTIGELMPIDETKAKLYIFDVLTTEPPYNDIEDVAFGRAQLYFSSVIEKGLTIHVRTGAKPVTPKESGYSLEIHRHEHPESMNATYNVNLYKFDSETGKPLADSHWDILERFDDSQLDNTSLDLTTDNLDDMYESALGSLNQTPWGTDDVESNYNGDMGVNMSDSTLYNWANDDGSQFEKWGEDEEDPCRKDDNITGEDGKLYEADSYGNITTDVAHTDRKSYTYDKGYCDGHPAPVIEYIVCDHDADEDCDCDERNQELHDEAWAAWYKEVVHCEQLVAEGGFFHCISTDGAAKKALEEDRDQFYKDFISLTYEYSAKEITAPKGYIRHGVHTDDIPMEWRCVTSSEYKDTEEAAVLKHTDSSDAGDDAGSDTDTDTDDEIDTTSDDSLEDGVNMTALTDEASIEESSETATESNATFVSGAVKIASIRALENAEEKEEAETESTEEEVEEETEEDATATDSDATASDAVPEHTIAHTGFIETIRETASGIVNRLFSILLASDEEEDVNDEGETGNKNGGWIRDTLVFVDPEGILTLETTKANKLVLALDDIVDWTFITYDHRTEGEIHFNKRDFDLNNDVSDTYDNYAEENGDGSLEGAVYGLFAAQDIVHPDTDGEAANPAEGDTGIVFKKDDLVAVATTDRNGDGSFMAITEAPGSAYNYETGKIEHTDWYNEAPSNLYINEEASAAKEQDIEMFVGHNPDNSEITAGNGNDLPDTGGTVDDYFWKNSTNQEYDSGMLENNPVTNRKTDTWREDETIGHYPISDNESNNGNCWIGRPLILGKDGSSYYIKELSRSEGYELSVYGSDQELMTNREAFEAGGEEFASGSATATAIKNEKESDGNTFTVKSSGTQNGYVLKVTNVPEGAAFYITTTEYVLDENTSHQEIQYVPVEIEATEGNYVMLGGSTIKASLGDTITYNGKTFTVNNVKTIDNSKLKVSPSNRNYVENPSLDTTKITESGNVMNDINTLFSKSGFRKVATGSPWIAVPVDSLTVENVAKAINEKVFTDPAYSAYNAMEMIGGFIQNGRNYAAIGYCYRDASVNDSVYNEKTDQILVKKAVTYQTAEGTVNGFAYRAYDASACESVVRNNNEFITSAIVPNETVAGSPSYAKEILDGTLVYAVRPSDSYWTYAKGEKLLDNNGDIAVRYETTYVDVTPTMVEKVTNEKLEDVSYNAEADKVGTYTIAISQKLLDKTADDTINFRILYENDTKTIDGTEVACQDYTKAHGSVGIIFPYDTADSYIKTVALMYHDDETIADDAGTIEEPTKVSERPIRQKIKVFKDIETLPESKNVWYCLNCGYENQEDETTCEHCGHERTTEETKAIQYAHDTYSAVHSENISADRDAGLYTTAKDWLTKLMGGEVAEESASNIPNFRFKAYLKSNLERLYRDKDGTITWIDRNGNIMIPQYEDTNGDGNYDTFTWKYDTAYDGKTIDFPEKDKMIENALDSSNIQKIYTSILHEGGSKTTSARANNVWAEYKDPNRLSKDFGEKEPYTTSERTTADGSTGDVSGNAVDTAAALYGYSGKNEDVVNSDRIFYTGDNANGTSRLLETTKQTIEDGAKTREIETYNYEKFFDAIEAANTDIWDNDMHSTFNGSEMSNYPGEHWFETFYENYQKDDADPDHTIANTDGADKDNTAGGDRDTSFKPFRWIREFVFGDRSDYETYPADHNGANTETVMSTSDYARANAEASDAVRQFATKWYLKQEALKLQSDNGNKENIAAAADGEIQYDEELYDQALFEAIAKTYKYLKPFYTYDLDTIYSVEWDSAENGGSDNDYTTLSVDFNEGDEYSAASSYLPYGTYVIVEQQPSRRDNSVNDWTNRSYTIEKPKEVMVPTLYDAAESNDTTDNYNSHYTYDTGMTTEDQAKQENYLIRFGEEWSDDAANENQDERHYVIRAHNYHGDFEVYKYGLDIDLLNDAERRYDDIQYGDSYSYAGWKYTQGETDPLKDYYDTAHRGEEAVEAIGEENGGNDSSDYMAIDRTNGADTANGETYNGIDLQNRFFYGSISEDKGTADNVMYKGDVKDDNNASGMYFKDSVTSMTGELTAYNGKYAQMLVPWTVTEPADAGNYDSQTFNGYADVNERDGFFTTFLRVNKTDSETGEYILHDDAIFALYAGSRYQSFEEIENDAKLITDAEEKEKFLAQFKPGDAKFYLQDTQISGSMEFLKAMKAVNIQPAARGRSLVESGTGAGETYVGTVKKGTPICLESERIMLTDELGNRTGQMTVFSTMNDVEVTSEDNASGKEYVNQNTGYFVTPQPIGAGVYVLAEIKAPSGYARSNPIAYEVYSDQTSYYVDGDMYSKVSAVRYDGNLLTDINYK